MGMIDTHAHIYHQDLKVDIDHVLASAKENGVDRIYMPDIDHTSTDAMMELAEKYPGFCFPMIGLHPSSVGDNYKQELSRIEKKLGADAFYGLGETGIDLYWDKSTFHNQVISLEAHIQWALDSRLPIILHTREATDETIDIIAKYQNGNLKGIFHCFTTSPEHASKIRDLGFLIGIGGVVTFKNTDLRKTLESVPLDQIVLETDSPYLAPVPYRGKRNDPSLLPLIAEKLAAVYNTSVSEIGDITSKNALDLFHG